MNNALQLAAEGFKKADPATISRLSGTKLRTVDSQERIEIDYLGCRYLIYLPEVEIVCQDSAKKASLREKTIILHYLAQSKGTPSSGRWIDLRELPGGITYYPVFVGRVHRPFLKVFGNNPSLFLKAAQALKSIQAEVADFSAQIQVFPRVPIIFALYQGDEEFPPDCKILFDANITGYLSTEDVVVVCEETVRKLKFQSFLSPLSPPHRGGEM
jgi:hypothetical protein